MGEVRESEWRGGPAPQEGGEDGEEVGEPRLIGSIFPYTRLSERTSRSKFGQHFRWLFGELPLHVDVCRFKRLSPVKEAWLGENVKRGSHILSASKRASGSNINQIQLQMHIIRNFSHPPKSFLSKMTLSQETDPYLKEYTCNIFVYLQQSPFRTIVLDHKVAAPYKPEYHNDIYI